LAAAGAHVVHVDASAPAVKWARRNADDSQLADRPIRWIVDDARKFVAREVRRGNRYQLIVLDPPSFGHGPNGKRWSIESDIDGLLGGCLELLADGPAAVLLTAHCEHPNASEMASRLQRRAPELNTTHGRLQLGSSPTILDAGYFVRGMR
jgi:23S rRNA (cytosine1962-C5)-methyltransferase